MKQLIKNRTQLKYIRVLDRLVDLLPLVSDAELLNLCLEFTYKYLNSLLLQQASGDSPAQLSDMIKEVFSYPPAVMNRFSQYLRFLIQHTGLNDSSTRSPLAILHENGRMEPQTQLPGPGAKGPVSPALKFVFDVPSEQDLIWYCQIRSTDAQRIYFRPQEPSQIIVPDFEALELSCQQSVKALTKAVLQSASEEGARFLASHPIISDALAFRLRAHLLAAKDKSLSHAKTTVLLAILASRKRLPRPRIPARQHCLVCELPFARIPLSRDSSCGALRLSTYFWRFGAGPQCFTVR